MTCMRIGELDADRPCARVTEARMHGVLYLASSPVLRVTRPRVDLVFPMLERGQASSARSVSTDINEADSHDAMTARPPGTYHNYPATYFSAAPTYFVWNALSARDIHTALQSRPGFEGQNLHFVLNHPIRFVRIVGLIVGIELPGNGKHLLLAIDDGSGSTIECRAEVRLSGRQEAVVGTGKSNDEGPRTTLVDNLHVEVKLGVPAIAIDKRPVDIGTVVKAKGTIETFRQQRQIKLERIRIVRDTNEEAKAWQETADWKADVLSKPWILTDAEKAGLDTKLAERMVKEREDAKQRRVKDAKYAERKRRHEEKKEKKRRRLEGAFDSGALRQSAVLPDRLTDS